MAAKSTIGLLMIGRSGCSGMVFQNPLISLLDKDFDSLHFTFFFSSIQLQLSVIGSV